MNDLPLTYAGADGWKRSGEVTGVSARSISVDVPGLSPGVLTFVDRPGLEPLAVVVVAVCGRIAACASLGETYGVTAGARAVSNLARVGAFVGTELLGRSVDAWGRCADAPHSRACRLDRGPIALRDRAPITVPLWTRVPAIDAFATIGRGQRVALFAGAGVGKTALVRRIVEHARVDARVIALVGERGREAAEIHDAFRAGSCWPSTTVVCATSETPAIERIAAARTATAQAEALADAGYHVLLVMDSLTRVATAWREIALAAGEAPAHRGHPASLASMLAALVERAGSRRNGSVTAIYTVLVDGDDLREPVTDTVRSLLDGHIVLSRGLAEAGRFPAIDVLRCVSRLMDAVARPEHIRHAYAVRRAMAALERAEDIFAIGAYESGADRALDAAVAQRAEIEDLVFDGDGSNAPRDPVAALAAIAAGLEGSD
jgi:flagellum-specific ATP synthase